MDRRNFVSAAAGVLLVKTFAGHAQTVAPIPRVGVLFPGTPAIATQFVAAFDQGLRERGWVDGQNVIVERRYGNANLERMVEIAAELVRMKVDVIVTATDVAITEIRRQTLTIPIVMANSTDPVATGFVASLARPGGNITGITSISPELNAKRLEILKEAVPGLIRVGIIWNPDDRGGVLDYKETESAAPSLRLQVQSVEVSRSDDFERAFSVLTTGRADAVIVIPSALTYTNRVQIATLALKHRLPSMFGAGQNADAGGLISYGPSYADTWRRSAFYVDRILKGAKPGDLPVEQPTLFEFVINQTTAKALGLTLPPSLVRRADRVSP